MIIKDPKFYIGDKVLVVNKRMRARKIEQWEAGRIIEMSYILDKVARDMGEWKYRVQYDRMSRPDFGPQKILTSVVGDEQITNP